MKLGFLTCYLSRALEKKKISNCVNGIAQEIHAKILLGDNSE